MFTFKKNKLKKTEVSEETWFNRLKKGLQKTREGLGSGIANIFLGKKTIDAELYEQLETQLLLADTGIETTDFLSLIHI